MGEISIRQQEWTSHDVDTHVERKGDTGVGEHDEGSQFAELVEWCEPFGEGNDACVDDGADRGVVVKGDDGVHLENMVICQPNVGSAICASLTFMPCSRI